MVTNSKSILIYANGSHAIGMGHIFRMRTLALSLQLTDRVHFVTLENTKTSQLLKEAGVSFTCYSPSDFMTALGHAIGQVAPDVVVLDVLDTTEELFNIVRRFTLVPVVSIDDCGVGLIKSNAVVNITASFCGRYDPKHAGTRLYEGVKYMLMPQEYAVDIQNRVADPRDPWKLLVAFGGSDNHSITERAIRAINTLDESLEITVNLGPASRESPELLRAVRDSPHRLSLKHFVPSLFKCMAEVDLVICSGGMTLFEAGALGVPAVSIAAEPHEVFSAKHSADAGASIALGWERTLDFSSLTEALVSLKQNPGRLIDMSEKGKALVDGLGVERVKGIIRTLTGD